MTAVYVRRLFDQHAPDFDQALRQRLDYRGPELLQKAVQSVCQVLARPMAFAALPEGRRQ